MISKEFRQGFFAVWALLSLAALFILLIPFIFPESTIYNMAPMCENRRLGIGECSLCGMTRAFIQISKGDFSRAFVLNRASLALYGILVLNLVIFFLRYAFKYYLTRSLKNT